jgi:hypothetical protein
MLDSVTWASSITTIYTVSHLIRLAFYWPQLRCVLNAKDTSVIAVSTWLFWSFHNFLTVLYLCFVSLDLWLGALFFASGVCTSCIALLAMKNRGYWRYSIKLDV